MAFFYSADLPSGFSKCISSSGLVLISVYTAPSHTLALPLVSVFSFLLLGLSVVYVIADHSLGQATSLSLLNSWFRVLLLPGVLPQVQ